MLNSLPEELFLNTKLVFFDLIASLFFSVQHLPFILPTQIHESDQREDF